MLFTELPVAFPWYPDKRQQSRYNENAEAICSYKLITPVDALLRFEFWKPAADFLPNLWEIFNADSDQQVANISPSIPMITRKKIEGKEYYYYKGDRLNATTGLLNLPQGFYYSRLVFPNGEMYFSEMFFVPDLHNYGFNVADDDNINFLRLEWWNDGDLRPIFYNNVPAGATVPDFRNVIYLDSFVTNSEPQITEDGTRDGEDTVIETFQKALIAYRITVVVPDFLKRALMLLEMHDHVLLTTKWGVRSGEIERIEVASTLEANGALSVVDMLFQEDMAMVKKGCADNMIFD